MSRHYADPDERALAEQLKRQAAADSPPHSRLLHARIMRAVESAGQDAVHGSSASAWRAGAALAAAAAIALVIWTTNRQPDSTPANRPERIVHHDPRPPVPAVDELLGRTAASTLARLQSKLDEGRLAYLDHDARRLARFVLDQTNVLPPPN